jgi:hypothetical protein
MCLVLSHGKNKPKNDPPKGWTPFLTFGGQFRTLGFLGNQMVARGGIDRGLILNVYWLEVCFIE